jgi:hypothetical protein
VSDRPWLCWPSSRYQGRNSSSQYASRCLVMLVWRQSPRSSCCWAVVQVVGRKVAVYPWHSSGGVVLMLLEAFGVMERLEDDQDEAKQEEEAGGADGELLRVTRDTKPSESIAQEK